MEPNTQVPDDATVKRIENLGAVGTALEEWSNGSKYDANILQAKQSLKAFHEGINHLQLSTPAKLGMDNLVKVLDKMLDEKLQDTFTTTQQNF